MVIITQRDRAISDSDIQYFSKRGKFEKGKESDKKDSINKYFEYYETELWQNIILKLGNAIKSERASIRAFSKLDGNMIDEVSKERVFQSYNGDISYRNLTKEDVDRLVEKISTLIKKVSK